MDKIDIGHLLSYLKYKMLPIYTEFIKDSVSQAYIRNILPSEVDDVLTQDIKNVAYEYAEEYDIPNRKIEDYLFEHIDDIYFKW